MNIFRGIAISLAAIALAASVAYGHSALNRFWGEVPVDMLLSGDVLIVKTLVVPQDVTLTIEPGTVVRFEGADGSNAIIVRGRLVATGSKDSRIRFIPKDEKTGPFRGVIFEGGSGVMTSCDVVGATEGVSDPAGRVRLVDVEVKQ